MLPGSSPTPSNIHHLPVSPGPMGIMSTRRKNTPASSSSKLGGLHASADDTCLSTIRYLHLFQTVGLHGCSILNAQIGQLLSRNLAVIRRLSVLLQPIVTTAWLPSPVQPFGTSSASTMHWFMLPRRICLNQRILPESLVALQKAARPAGHRRGLNSI